MWKRFLLVFGGLVLLGVGACQLFWPERFAVNAPLRNFLGGGIETPTDDSLRGTLRVPEGFSVGLYAAELRNARFLRFTPAGDLLVSTPRSGTIWLLERDADGDGRADGRRQLLDGLNRPHGMDFHDGWLYVAETDAIGRVRFDAAAGEVRGDFERVVTGLPTGGNHWTRTLRFGPDGGMYVSIGSSCNVCLEEDPRRAGMLRYEPDGSGEEIFATGLRNAVGFDWQPDTGSLFATDNGRDLLGDNYPPCELNDVVRGGDYGWPVANGPKDPDPDFGDGREERIAASLPPAHPFRAHTAPLGITFVRGDRLPPDYRNAALVALHGSWNRTEKDGYEVVSLHWAPDGSVTEREFLTGFLVDDAVSGRPVDVAEGPDGAFYISDDYAMAIYRVVYGEAPTQAAEVMPRLAPKRAGQVRGDVEAGAALYERHACASCHEEGRTEEGVVARPLERLHDRYDEVDLAEFLLTPTPPMPIFPLDEQERLDLAAYLLSETE